MKAAAGVPIGGQSLDEQRNLVGLAGANVVGHVNIERVPGIQTGSGDSPAGR